MAAHQIRASLMDIQALSTAVKELAWFTGTGGYTLTDASAAPDGSVIWTLAAVPPPPAAPTAPPPVADRQTVEPGDQVVVETKGQQLSRRFGGSQPDGVEGAVFRVLTRGPHPHGMKVELRDGTVGRVKRNLTAPGAGEPNGRR